MNNRFANWLLSKFIISDFHEEFLGDLEEIHNERLEKSSILYAKIMYWVDAIHLIIGFSSLKPSKSTNSKIIMTDDSLKMAWRSALKQKQFTLLNILGLYFWDCCLSYHRTLYL